MGHLGLAIIFVYYIMDDFIEKKIIYYEKKMIEFKEMIVWHVLNSNDFQLTDVNLLRHEMKHTEMILDYLKKMKSDIEKTND
jgi:hypothetical protein